MRSLSLRGTQVFSPTNFLRFIAVTFLILIPCADAANLRDTAVRSLPSTSKPAWPNQVEQLWKNQNWPALLVACKEWSATEPDPWEPWYCIAIAGLNAKLYNDSLRGFEAYQKREDPLLLTPDSIHNHAFVLGQLGRFDEAVSVIDEAIKIDASNHVIWALRGWLLVNDKRYREARRSCLMSLQRNLDYAETWHILGAANWGLGQNQLAIEAYEISVSLPQDNPDIERSEYWLPLGELYVITGQREKALRVLEMLDSMDKMRSETLRKQIAEMK